MANIAKRTSDWFKNEDSGTGLQAGRNARNLSAFPTSYFGPLSSFFSDMDRVFDHTFRTFGIPTLKGLQGLGMFNPNVDIIASDDEYTINCEVPGLEEKDLKLDVSADGMLTISGEKRQESSDNRKDVYCTECSYGSFERTLSLPDDADHDNIEARFKNGVLTITCPRTESERQSRRHIPIGSGREGVRASNANERGASQHQQNPKKAA